MHFCGRAAQADGVLKQLDRLRPPLLVEQEPRQGRVALHMQGEEGDDLPGKRLQTLRISILPHDPQGAQKIQHGRARKRQGRPDVFNRLGHAAIRRGGQDVRKGEPDVRTLAMALHQRFQLGFCLGEAPLERQGARQIQAGRCMVRAELQGRSRPGFGLFGFAGEKVQARPLLFPVGLVHPIEVAVEHAGDDLGDEAVSHVQPVVLPHAFGKGEGDALEAGEVVHQRPLVLDRPTDSPEHGLGMGIGHPHVLAGEGGAQRNGRGGDQHLQLRVARPGEVDRSQQVGMADFIGEHLQLPTVRV